MGLKERFEKKVQEQEEALKKEIEELESKLKEKEANHKDDILHPIKTAKGRKEIEELKEDLENAKSRVGNIAKEKKTSIIIWAVAACALIFCFVFIGINAHNEKIKKAEEEAASKFETAMRSNAPSSFTKNYEEAEFDKYNSPADKNGLGGSMVYLNGTYSEVTSFESSGFEYYQAIFTDRDENNWSIWLGVGGLDEKETYDTLVDQPICILANYQGYSETNKMPSLAVKAIYNKLTDESIETNFYQELLSSNEVTEIYVDDKTTMPGLKTYSIGKAKTLLSQAGISNYKFVDEEGNELTEEDNYYVTDQNYLVNETVLKDAEIIVTCEYKEPEVKDETQSSNTTNNSSNTNTTTTNSEPLAYEMHKNGIYMYIYIDEAAGYIYMFDPEDTVCQRFKIVSGDLNSTLIAEIESTSRQYGFCYKWKNQPENLIYDDGSGVLDQYRSTDVSSTKKMLDEKTIID